MKMHFRYSVLSKAIAIISLHEIWNCLKEALYLQCYRMSWSPDSHCEVRILLSEAELAEYGVEYLFADLFADDLAQSLVGVMC